MVIWIEVYLVWIWINLPTALQYPQNKVHIIEVLSYVEFVYFLDASANSTQETYLSMGMYESIKNEAYFYSKRKRMEDVWTCNEHLLEN